MRRRILAIAILAIPLLLSAAGNLETAFADSLANDKIADLRIPEVVARVNGVDLSSKFVKFEFARMTKNLKGDLDVKQKTQIVREIVNSEVVRELMYQEGLAQNKKAAPQKIDEEFEAMKSGYATEAEFQEALKERSITAAELKKSIEVELVARKLLDDQIKGSIDIPDAEVKLFYEDNKKDFFRPEAYRAQHIFASLYPMEAFDKYSQQELEAHREKYDKDAERKINGILKEVQSGKDFGELARKYSDDAGSSSKGGDLDFIYKGVFDPAIDEAVSKLKPGEISGVVKTPYGYHIVKLNETRPAEFAPFKDVKEAIQEHLFMAKAKDKVQQYIAELRKKAKIELFF
ncbi:MAG: peptidylprolyl isomerase [Nitrospinae bacterium]|nr:peptidylprolyl isomerase [Nitrospinota bacterium]